MIYKITTIPFVLLMFFTKASAQVVAIETANTSLVYATDANKRLIFQYYGSKLNNPGVFPNDSFQNRDQLRFVISDPYNNNAYPSFGNIQVDEPAICAIHADGSLMTDLVFDGVKTEADQKGNKHSVIYLKDIRLIPDTET